MVDGIANKISSLNSIPSNMLSIDGFIIEEIRGITLHQIAAWPDTITVVKKKVLKLINAKEILSPTTVAIRDNATTIWIDPLKFWLLGTDMPDLKADIGTALDLSHAYVHLRVSGKKASTLLNKHIPIDLREQSFPDHSTATSAIHHVQVRLWRQSDTYHLLIPRSFAQSICEMLIT